MFAARPRIAYTALALATIAVGLLVHLRGSFLPAIARDVLGDALWATMIVWWIGALAPRAHTALKGGAAYVVCAGVEASQLFHSPALDAARATLLGRLVLGSDFDVRDLVAYAVGCIAAAVVDAKFSPRSSRRLSFGSQRDTGISANGTERRNRARDERGNDHR
ncbi:MAG: DUF2809 domain-containing protein [Gemmatimonadaceae bacterium]